jgi:tetratricopeptide (TPR) repeat protein
LQRTGNNTGACKKINSNIFNPHSTSLADMYYHLGFACANVKQPEKAVQYDKSAIEIMQKLPGPKSDAVFYYAQVSSANDYMSSRQYDVAERYLTTLLKQPAPTDWRKRQYDVLVHVLTLSQKDDEAARCKQEMPKLE